MNIDLSSSIKSPAEALDNLFGNNLSIAQLDISTLEAYPMQHKFKAYQESKLMELIEDIKVNGVLSPIIVRPTYKSDGTKYQILAGHHRAKASQMAGKLTVPAIIKEGLTEEQAKLIFVTTNLNQRETLSPSEKAFAYKEQMNSLCATQGRTTAEIAEKYGENKRQIQRYLRLAELSDDLLGLLDAGQIDIKAGVALSYITGASQKCLFDFLKSTKSKIDLDKAESIQRQGRGTEITKEFLESIYEKKTQDNKPVNLGVSKNIYDKYFGRYTKNEAQEKLNIILNEYFKEENT